MFDGEGEDEEDFIPGANSKLASLFAKSSPLPDDNVSLTYTPPKQPKKMSEKKDSAQEPPTLKLNIIIVKVVTSYKLENGNYNSHGKLGVALLGNPSTKTYQLLLYKGKQQHITTCQINAKFQFIVQANNYASFYDDQQQNWSIMFESREQAIEFTTEVGLSRANAQVELNEILTQDLIFVEGTGASLDDTMELRYRAFVLTPTTGVLGKEIESTLTSEKPQRVKLRVGGWEEGLIGVGRHGRRLLIIPYSLVTSAWRRLMPADTWLILDVYIGRFKSSKSPKTVSKPIENSGIQAQDSGDSTFESSEDSSVKARTATISVALSNSPRLASKKATLISRMAKMGQPTLPLPGSIAGPSDSEETEEEASIPNTIIFRPSSKTRTNSLPPNKTASKPSPPNSTPVQHIPQIQQQADSITLYQTMPWLSHTHQQQSTSQQTTPIQFYQPNPGMSVSTPTAVLTPIRSIPTTNITNDSAQMTLFLAESRTQGAEMRMGLARITDKVDQVISKIDSLDYRLTVNNVPNSVANTSVTSISSLNSAAIQFGMSNHNTETQLNNIQRLSAENERLQKILNEKQERLDEQNDKIFHLINTNQRLMEQSASLLEEKSQKVMEINSLVREENSLKEVLDQITKTLYEFKDQSENNQQKENDIKVSDLTQQQIISMSSLLKIKENELKSKQATIFDQSNRLLNLEASLQAALESQHSQEQSMSTLQTSLGELQANKEQLEMWLADTTRQLHDAASEAASKKNEIQVLKQQITDIMNKSNDPGNLNEEVKRVMNVLYKKLQAEFEPGCTYDGSIIRTTLLHIIRDVTLNLLAHNDTNVNSPLKNSNTKEINPEPSIIVHQQVPPEPKPRVIVNSKPQPPNEPPENEKEVCSDEISINTEKEVDNSSLVENDANELEECNKIQKIQDNSIPKVDEDKVDPLSAVDTVITRSPKLTEKHKKNEDEKKPLDRECRLSPPPQIFEDDDDDEDWLN